MATLVVCSYLLIGSQESIWAYGDCLRYLMGDALCGTASTRKQSWRYTDAFIHSWCCDYVDKLLFCIDLQSSRLLLDVVIYSNIYYLLNQYVTTVYTHHQNNNKMDRVGLKIGSRWHPLGRKSLKCVRLT